jgi:hypothetical protein
MLTPGTSEGLYNYYLKDFVVKKDRIVFDDDKVHPEEEFKVPLINTSSS